MQSVMFFENDLFISYAHIDNKPLTEGQKGWISQFHKDLENRLGQVRGQTPRIWRDEKLRGNDVFAEEIVGQFPRVALLVSVVSPRYVKSEWCIRELRAFCQASRQTGGVQLGTKSRLFKVIKTPIPQELQPEELQPLLGYEFYQRDQSGHFREFSYLFGPVEERNYWFKLDDLAQDIDRLLASLNQAATESGTLNEIASGPSIYLADTTYDLIEVRDSIRRELLQHDCEVLPDCSLPHTPKFRERVQEMLAHCQLSIHLIGERYGAIPEGETDSMIALQHHMAVARSQAEPPFTPLVWMPPGLQPLEPRQVAFVQALQNEGVLLQMSLEDLKTLIQDTLKPQPQTSGSVDLEAELVQVYLICDQRDLTNSDDTLERLENLLWEQGVEVIPSLFDGDEEAVRQYHQTCLKDCDAAILYYGQGCEAWLRTQLAELRKAPGYGRQKPLLAKAIYVAGPKTERKIRFRTREAIVIKQFDGFSPEPLQVFVKQVGRF